MEVTVSNHWENQKKPKKPKQWTRNQAESLRKPKKKQKNQSFQSSDAWSKLNLGSGSWWPEKLRFFWFFLVFSMVLISSGSVGFGFFGFFWFSLWFSQIQLWKPSSPGHHRTSYPIYANQLLLSPTGSYWRLLAPIGSYCSIQNMEDGIWNI